MEPIDGRLPEIGEGVGVKPVIRHRGKIGR